MEFGSLTSLCAMPVSLLSCFPKLNKILGYARKRIAFGMDYYSRGSERQVFNMVEI